eukprot:CAMPEP_0195057834 /NCGR_PEP_ID=MMETSP0448-20130528/5864_1 /TAXON_ID=66468 /ORGANISM="Heterocapsa triquestra, Strain CCMP 448" /LENGTH=408 /DNA_ID=CAMNT_0040087895 /DNA_START=284 /DNA_END=1507 /DNA_ORIENTATION=+
MLGGAAVEGVGSATLLPGQLPLRGITAASRPGAKRELATRAVAARVGAPVRVDGAEVHVGTCVSKVFMRGALLRGQVHARHHLMDLVHVFRHGAPAVALDLQLEWHSVTVRDTDIDEVAALELLGRRVARLALDAEDGRELRVYRRSAAGMPVAGLSRTPAVTDAAGNAALHAPPLRPVASLAKPLVRDPEVVRPQGRDPDVLRVEAISSQVAYPHGLALAAVGDAYARGPSRAWSASTARPEVAGQGGDGGQDQAHNQEQHQREAANPWRGHGRGGATPGPLDGAPRVRRVLELADVRVVGAERGALLPQLVHRLDHRTPHAAAAEDPPEKLGQGLLLFCRRVRVLHARPDVRLVEVRRPKGSLRRRRLHYGGAPCGPGVHHKARLRHRCPARELARGVAVFFGALE